ncbi:MAG: CtsR family transcriptional regulator [Thermincola sp.]|jgi:transcriptional regulator CtsR|nr:CtsR family transcriptional regulator [Thermincola sp.]MDT3704903.1 CtsR family transcriptional regulator [Thermincola sp.]
MPNITDIIEDYIKARLNQSTGGIVILRRNELAEKFRCVPSQINYVLSTRFSFNRGYIIETRRGGGGFIRVIRVPLEDSEDILDIVYDRIGEQVSLREAVSLISYLYEEDLISKREAQMMQNVVEIIEEGDQTHETGSKRAAVLKAMLIALLRHGR